jgi:hypothetical protein
MEQNISHVTVPKRNGALFGVLLTPALRCIHSRGYVAVTAHTLKT